MYNSQLGYLVKRAQQIVARGMATALSPTGLTVPQYWVLSILVHNPQVSGAALAREAGVSPQAMHELVRGLIKKGRLKRTDLVGNKKSFGLSLTPAGHHVLQQADAAIAQLDRNYAKTLGSVGYDQAARGLTAFNALIQ